MVTETTTVLAVVPSKSNPEKSYCIKRGQNGHVYCDCPAWKFQRISPQDRTCKHLKAFFAGELARKFGEQVVSKKEAASELAKAPARDKRRRAAHDAFMALKRAGQV